jgi:YwqJ-like deaminase
MGNKIITEKDFWMCSSGAVPAQLQGTRKSNKKESGEVYITVADTATSSWIDFGCTKSMLFAALIAAVVAVVVVALIVGTGGIAAIGLMGMMAIGAGAGILGGVVAAVDGALKCGQRNATQRQWIGSKQNLILTGVPAITGDRTMTCKIGGVVKFAPEIKSWSQAIGLAGLNYLTKFAECGLAGMAVGGGGYIFAGLATGSLALAMPTVSSVVSNVTASFTGIFGASRLLFGANTLANDAAMGNVDGAGDALSAFGGGAIPELGSMKRIVTGQAQPTDALLLLYLLHLKTPTPKENVAPKEEAKAKPKEESKSKSKEEVVKPTETEPQTNANKNNGKKGEAFEDGVAPKRGNEDLVKAVEAEAAKEIAGKSKTANGPCLSGVYDPVTGQTQFGKNFRKNAAGRAEYAKFVEDAHPIIKERIKAQQKLIDENKMPPETDNRAGAHSEVRALDKAIKAREAATGKPVTESDLGSFDLHNRHMPNNNAMHRCVNCTSVTDGVNPVGGHN